MDSQTDTGIRTHFLNLTKVAFAPGHVHMMYVICENCHIQPTVFSASAYVGLVHVYNETNVLLYITRVLVKIIPTVITITNSRTM